MAKEPRAAAPRNRAPYMRLRRARQAAQAARNAEMLRFTALLCSTAIEGLQIVFTRRMKETLAD